MIKEMTNTDHKTFPMVFRNDVFIGGFTQTKEFLEQCEKDAAFDFV